MDGRGTDADTALSINASTGWKKVSDDSKEVIVAVIDSGVNYYHEDLQDVMWTNPGNIGLKGEHGYNFAGNNGDSYKDDVGHGTHCAGVIAAQANNLKGVAGIGSQANVKIMALQTMSGMFGPSTAYCVYGAFNYVHKAVQGGVNVVATSNSWGGHLYASMYDDVINLLGEDGVLTFIASGNENADTDKKMFEPANTTSEYAVTVGAADITGSRALFSNYGKASVDVFGPGVNILSTVSYPSFFPTIYGAEELNSTTEYYGEFNADTKVINGTITPSTGSKAGDDVKAFGSLQFVKQKQEQPQYEPIDDGDDFDDGDDTEDATEEPGDDGDGKVTITDATMIQKYLAEFNMPDNFVFDACDVDKSGSITVTDVTQIQRYLAGLDAPEGIGKPIN